MLTPSSQLQINFFNRKACVFHTMIYFVQSELNVSIVLLGGSPEPRAAAN